MQNQKTTLLHYLQTHADSVPDQIAYYFITADGREQRISYGELLKRTYHMAAQFTVKDRGERALILLPPGFDYIVAFLGCLSAGVIAVPVYPPRNSRHHERLQAIIDDADARYVITNQDIAERYPFDQKIHRIDEVLSASRSASSLSLDHLNHQAIAFLQYTSGSTGNPKGVMVSHENILNNCEAVKIVYGEDNLKVACSWLPPYHDMGLIGGILFPIYTKMPIVLLAPTTFIKQPLLWLDLIDQYHVSISLAPNFAYQLCVEAMKKRRDALAKRWNLSCWKIALNGAEPVQGDVLEAFCAQFSQYGLSKQAIWPTYGLAESTLAVSILDGFENGLLISRHRLEADGQIELIGDNESDRKELISCGKAIPGHHIEIVDADHCVALGEDSVGEIWVSGPSLAQGYWRKNDETMETFQASLAHSNKNQHYLRTGDLGFLHQGELYLVGRVKEVIIIRGINYMASDLEHTIERSHAQLMKEGGIAFSIESGQGEQLVIVQAVQRHTKNYDQVVKAIQQRLYEVYELSAAEIMLVKPHSLPKTSSGKKQRFICKAQYGNKQLKVLYQWSQAGRDAVISSKVVGSPVADKLLSMLANAAGREVETIDVTKNIFSLGIDSVNVVQLLAKFQSQYPVKIDIDTLEFDQPIADLLSYLAALVDRGDLDNKPVNDQKTGAKLVHKKHAVDVANALPDISIMFFENDASQSSQKYKLFNTVAQVADQGQFQAIWIPERHFHRFGGMYPNPSILASYLAARTERIRIRSGAVVLPLHDVIRVAEEWAVVDHLSNSRVDMAFAIGWNPNDYVFFPERYPDRHTIFWQQLNEFESFWQGNSITRANGKGETVDIKLYPQPVQSDLQTWVVCTGSEERFIEAGQHGKNVLTALLFQEKSELAQKIACYRQARQAAGYNPNEGKVSLMLHTAIDTDREKLKEKVKPFFIRYLESSINLWQHKFKAIEPKDQEQKRWLLNYAFERYYAEKSLIGSSAECQEKLRAYREIGVDEVAALIDFVPDQRFVIAGVNHLNSIYEKRK
ncbi:MAG: MupA/Atu3671 family FMN-dependent luciferase-like monooxygenase [Pseudomonadota bacterium]